LVIDGRSSKTKAGKVCGSLLRANKFENHKNVNGITD